MGRGMNALPNVTDSQKGSPPLETQNPARSALTAVEPAVELSEAEAAEELLAAVERVIPLLPVSSCLRWALVGSLDELSRLAGRAAQVPHLAVA